MFLWQEKTMKKLGLFLLNALAIGTIFAFGMAFQQWLTRSNQLTRPQKEAVLAIEELGGSVSHLNGEVLIVIFYSHNITDANLVHLKEMHNLRRLSLRRCTLITSTGLVHLKEMAKLRILNLENTNVDDAGIIHLKELHSLEDLKLNYTQVTDACLVHLKQLTSLRWLNLNNTKISDAGLVHLKEMTDLRILRLAFTQITKDGMEELRKALPNCTVMPR